MSLMPAFNPFPNVAPATGLIGPICLALMQQPAPQNGNSLAGCMPCVEENDKIFKIHVKLQQFAPNEIKVRLVGQDVVVEACHEEKKEDKGFMKQQFKYQYQLPSCVDAAGLTSQLSSDSILTVSAPKQVDATEQLASRDIQIVLTNEPVVLPGSGVSTENVQPSGPDGPEA
ncbi:alpha-crystallin A chain-like [Bacillus rossius redtenbacheri]|uniref:alpha-crystallin A chain-like n=1 Tax=Bacillus rossius redtenbacheri TaxID=93214 RepID=UPI002FDD6360